MRARRRLRNVYDLRPDIDRHPARRRESFPEIVEDDFWAAYESSKTYSLLHVTGFYNLYQSVRHVAANDVPGDFVECGTLFGGASMFVVVLCEMFGIDGRTVHVFDTFEGFPEGSQDRKRGVAIRGPRYDSFFDAVVHNFEVTCGTHAVEFHRGDVRATLDDFDVATLALVRLDTDFYDSTRKELEVLYPRLAPGGVVIVDDYGSYDGSRRATDEYLDSVSPRPLLQRVDAGIWAGVKP